MNACMHLLIELWFMCDIKRTAAMPRWMLTADVARSRGTMYSYTSNFRVHTRIVAADEAARDTTEQLQCFVLRKFVFCI